MLERDRDVIDRTETYRVKAAAAASRTDGTAAILTVGMLINDGLYRVAEAIERIGDVETAVENIATAVETIGDLEVPLTELADNLSDIGPQIKRLADR